MVKFTEKDFLKMFYGGKGVVTSGYGHRHRPKKGASSFHRGVDVGVPIGTPLFSPADGTVSFIGPRGGYGNVIILDHPGGYQSLYAHNSGFPKGLAKGGKVTKGMQVAISGNTGTSTGPHSHYEIMKAGNAFNPLGFDYGALAPPPGWQPPYVPPKQQMAQVNTLAPQMLAQGPARMGYIDERPPTPPMMPGQMEQGIMQSLAHLFDAAPKRNYSERQPVQSLIDQKLYTPDEQSFLDKLFSSSRGV
jgi:Membrane proteins related to metalloendopeptidases